MTGMRPYGFASGGEEAHRQIARSAQPRRGIENRRNAIHDDRSGGDVTVRAARNGERQIGIADDFDRVARLLRADVHLQFHVDFFLAAGKASRDLVHAGNLPCGDFEEIGFHALARDDRLDRFRDLIHVQAQRVGNHRHGLGQAVMLDRSRRNLRAEFLDAHSRAHFFLQRQAALRRVHDADGARGFDFLRRGAQRDQELVHHEAGIDARADQRDAPRLGFGIELRREFRIFPERIRQLFARRDDAGFRGQARHQLIHHAGQERGGRMDHHVGGFAQHGRGVIGDRHAPRRVGRAHHFAQVASRLGRIGIDGPDHFDGFLFAHQPHNRGSDGTDAVLHRTNFLLHDGLRRARGALYRNMFSPASRAAVTWMHQIWSDYDKAIARRVQPDSSGVPQLNDRRMS